MELRHLRYFVAVAEELHFGRAADRLHMAQPPLSQQIRALEHELGVQLLIRDRRHVELTQAGRLFLQEAQRTLEQADRAVAVARRAAKGQVGELLVGYSRFIGVTIVPEILRFLRAEYPDLVCIPLVFDTTPAVVEALLRHRVHAAFGMGPVDEPDLAVMRLGRDPLKLALPESHPLAQRTEVPLSALRDEPLALMHRDRNPRVYDYIINVFLQAGVTPRVEYETSDIDENFSLVGAGMAVSLISATVAKLGPPAGIACRDIVSPAPMNEILLLSRPDDESPTLKAFISAIRRLQRSGALEFS